MQDGPKRLEIGTLLVIRPNLHTLFTNFSGGNLVNHSVPVEIPLCVAII